MLMPSIGSSVQFHQHQEHRRRFGHDPLAAIVTKVHRHGATVDLVTFDAQGHSSGVQNVPFDRREKDGGETKFDPTTHWCGWPPEPEEFKDEPKPDVAKAKTPEQIKAGLAGEGKTDRLTALRNADDLREAQGKNPLLPADPVDQRSVAAADTGGAPPPPSGSFGPFGGPSPDHPGYPPGHPGPSPFPVDLRQAQAEAPAPVAAGAPQVTHARNNWNPNAPGFGDRPVRSAIAPNRTDAEGKPVDYPV